MRLSKVGLVTLTLALASCASGKGTAIPTAVVPLTATALPTRLLTATPVTASESNTTSTQTDNQGAIAVEVTPVDLAASGETLSFEVSLNTHSVELSMDLAAAATLTTDTGRSVAALEWNAPKGGHHVSGQLTFPGQVNGTPLLEGASRLTLILTGIDSPERRFTWALTS